jgi:hypothetical protein
MNCVCVAGEGKQWGRQAADGRASDAADLWGVGAHTSAPHTPQASGCGGGEPQGRVQPHLTRRGLRLMN